MAAGNFTGHANGTLDLAVVLANTSTNAYAVAVYAGAGNGSFATPVVSAAGNGIYGGNSSIPNTIAVGDFNGDGKPDLAFTTDDGLVDIMLATGGGSYGAAAPLTLPANEKAFGVVATDFNGDGKPDLVVEVNNYTSSHVFAGLVSYNGNGDGTFAQKDIYTSGGYNDYNTVGIVAGAFNGPDNGLEIALPIGSDDGDFVYVLPISAAGVFGGSTPYYTGSPGNSQFGNIVAGDFDGTGRPSIAVSDGTNQIKLLLADPDSSSLLGSSSNQSTPRTATFVVGSGSSAGYVGMIATAPFTGTAATLAFRGTPSETSVLLHNSNGTWSRTYPDGTLIQFDTQGREISTTDRNGNVTTYTYVPAGQPGAGALQTMTDPVGLVTTLAYNSAGTLTTITDPAGRVTQVVVSNGDLTQITDPDGAVEKYAYNAANLATKETDPNGYFATPQYNTFGQLTSETLFDNSSTTNITPAQSINLLAPGQSATGLLTYYATVTDPDHNTTTINMNRGSHPTSIIDPTETSNDPATYTYNTHGFVATSVDAAGHELDYTYDNNGNVTSIIEPAINYTTGSGGAAGTGAGSYSNPQTETIVYNESFGVPISITDFMHRTTTFTLDQYGNVLRRTDPDGLHEDWTYNAAGQPLTDTSRAGNKTTYTYNNYGQLVSITEPGPAASGSGSPQETFGYDPAGDLTSVTDERQNTTLYTYDQAGRVLTVQDPTQAADGTETKYSYDPDGNLLSVTDARGDVTTYTYTARDQLATVTDAVHQGTNVHDSYTYDAAGNLKSMTDMRGNETDYTYDGDDRLLTVSDAAKEVTKYTYDADGELLTTTDPLGNVTQRSYDKRGNLTSIALPGYSDPTGSGSGQPTSGSAPASGAPTAFNYAYNGTGTYKFAYDDDGELVYEVDPRNNGTSWAYNNLGLTTSTTDGQNDSVGTGYDGDLNLASTTDGLNHTTLMVYDSRDRLISETEPNGGGTTYYTYDDANNLTSVKDPDGNITSYTYDADNRRATMTSPTGGVTSYTYDDANNLIQTVDPDGRIIQYGYDKDNREISEKWLPVGGGTAFYTMTMAYDANGNLASVQDNYSQYTYSYDVVNRQTVVNNSGTPGSPQVALTSGYDANGNRTSLADSLGGTDYYSYDQRNQLDTVAQTGTSASGVDPELALMSYDQAGNLTTLSRYADLQANTAVASTAYTYDNANRLKSINDTNASGGTIATYAYTLDAANRLMSETHTWNGGNTTDTTSYTYTNNDQLTSVTHSPNSGFANESFSYDANGNRNASGQTTGTGNEIQSDGTYNYAYDPAGNLISKTSIATGAATLYKYDYRNRLTEVDSVVGGVASIVSVFTYDALNRQIGEADYPTGTGASAPMVGDSGFEAVAEGSGSSAYTYDPTGSAWSFAGDSGLSGNNSNFTSGNPNAPQGSQVAFLQDSGSISQTINFAAAGSYQLTFDAAQRENFPSDQSVQVLVDGTVVGTITPSGTTYGSYASGTFAVSAGSHTITLQGTSSSKYDTAFIDAVGIAVAGSTTPAVGDASFEAVAVGSGAGAYVYNPSGSAWTFSPQGSNSGSGVSGNNSNFTSGDPNAPQGSQVAFVQGTGTISQAVAGWAAGSYQISFDAIQRASYNSGGEDFEVLVDGNVVATFKPSGTSYQVETTPAFTVAAGSHTVSFVGLDSAGGDNTAFIDAVSIAVASSPTTPAVGDASFEAVSAGSSGYVYNPSGSAWTFSPQGSNTGSGVTGNNSPFTSGDPNAPQGSQVAFLQSAGTISQAISFATAGSYQISFDAIQRGNNNHGGENFEVLVDGNVVGTFQPSGSSYQLETTTPFTVGAGSHTITFEGLDSAGGDNTVFLDAVSIAVASPVAATYVGDSGFEAVAEGSGSSAYTYDPTGSAWSFAGDSGLSGNNSNFTSGNPNAPQGSQVAFLQDSGSISQTINFAAAGSYQLTFDAAQRENFPSDQSVQVLVDGTVVGTITPSGTTYGLYATSAFSVSAGAHTITLRGTSSSGYDTAFIDAVSIAGLATPTPAGASAVRWTVYDGQTPLLDFNGFGQQTARYLSVPGAIDELLARQTASGVAWYLDDREGSVGDIINNSGTVLDHVDYTAYGQVAAESAPGQGDRFKYAGMEFDAAIGMYYDRARYYDPAAGRFVVMDPIGFMAKDSNLYRFAKSDPIDFVDPSGKSGEDVESCYEKFDEAMKAANELLESNITQAALDYARQSAFTPSPYKNPTYPGAALAFYAARVAAYIAKFEAAEKVILAQLAACLLECQIDDMLHGLPRAIWDWLPGLPNLPSFPTIPVPPFVPPIHQPRRGGTIVIPV